MHITPLNRIHDATRKNSFGACYAHATRGVLLTVIPHLKAMQSAQQFFEWNAAYRSGIVTCRAALHVFHKKDSVRSPFLADALSIRFGIWKESSTENIFQLLDTERNMLLKEGRSTFPIEHQDSYNSEPRVLVGSQFMIGSDAVRFFVTWVLEEIIAVEDAAFWNRRATRIRNGSS